MIDHAHVNEEDWSARARAVECIASTPSTLQIDCTVFYVNVATTFCLKSLHKFRKGRTQKKTHPLERTKVTGKISAKIAFVIRGRMRYNGREYAGNQQRRCRGLGVPHAPFLYYSRTQQSSVQNRRHHARPAEHNCPFPLRQQLWRWETSRCFG